MKLQWTRHWDDQDNVFLEAESPYHDQGTAFHWRLRQRLANSRREWWDDSDTELGGRGESNVWTTQAEAIAAVQEAHDVILSKIANETISSEEIMINAKTLPCPCWFNDGTTQEPEWKPAMLHAWGTDYEEFESGPGLHPVGIVEDASGRIHSVYVTHISLASDSPSEPTA